jgi:hypothetical protein
MINFILMYVLGLFITTNIVVTWNMTNFPLHLSKLLFRKTITNDDVIDRDAWETWCILRLGTFGELLICPICHGHWIALAVGFILSLSFGFAFWFVPIAMFTYPWMSYWFLKKLSS